jgi:mannose-6-phosphate isomerase-like protein (cupin superfamily)
MNEIEKSVFVSEPATSNYLSVMGGNYRIVIRGESTNGDFALIEMLVPPGGGPGPHAHAGFHEVFFVVEGEIDVKSQAGTRHLSKGMSITIPKGGVVHAFRNNGQQTARLLCYVSPAGLEEFFEKVGQPVQQGEFLPPPPMDKPAIESLQKIAEDYGQKVFPPDYLDQP